MGVIVKYNHVIRRQVGWASSSGKMSCCATNLRLSSVRKSVPFKRQVVKLASLNLLFALGVSSCTASTSKESPRADPAAQSQSPLRDATILIIRHAEKPEIGTGLSSEGKARAEAYVKYFQNFRVKSEPIRLDYLVAADDSDHSQRSRLTLEPLGRAIGLKPDLRFQAKKPQELVRELQTTAHGKAILICWHHKEIPGLLKSLGADPSWLLPDGEWPAQQFAWVLQLRYDHNGELLPGKTKRIKEHLMPED